MCVTLREATTKTIQERIKKTDDHSHNYTERQPPFNCFAIYSYTMCFSVGDRMVVFLLEYHFNSMGSLFCCFCFQIICTHDILYMATFCSCLFIKHMRTTTIKWCVDGIVFSIGKNRNLDLSLNQLIVLPLERTPSSFSSTSSPFHYSDNWDFIESLPTRTSSSSAQVLFDQLRNLEPWKNSFSTL